MLEKVSKHDLVSYLMLLIKELSNATFRKGNVKMKPSDFIILKHAENGHSHFDCLKLNLHVGNRVFFLVIVTHLDKFGFADYNF